MRFSTCLPLIFFAYLFSPAFSWAHSPPAAPYSATADANGFEFAPNTGAPAWRWQLIGLHHGSISAFNSAECPDASLENGAWQYRFPSFSEQYALKSATIEQLFVLHAPLSKGTEDLVIEGAIHCAGEFARHAKGWSWRNAEGMTGLGDVYVFDAKGEKIPAKMQVTAEYSRIVVDGEALAKATYPVTVDPEVGLDDFMISEIGPTGVNTWDALDPDIVYNATNDEYLVVYEGSAIAGEQEIFAR
ncbi:MAG: hypothetical protein AAF570_25005, partial [Bacteroidota bacterium]